MAVNGHLDLDVDNLSGSLQLEVTLLRLLATHQSYIHPQLSD